MLIKGCFEDLREKWLQFVSMYDHLYLVRTNTALLHEVVLTTLMEQKTLTNPAVTVDQENFAVK